MKTLAVLAVVVGASAPPAPARAADPEVTVFRIADQGSLRVSGARASRGAGASATVVVVLESGRGDRLFLRRAPTDGGGIQHVASLGGPTGVTFTRRGDGTVLEAGGRALTVIEADLPRATVRCWMRALVSRVDPKLLEAAAAVRLVKEMTGGPALEDVYMPMTLLWQAADPTDLRPRGRVTLEKGPFSGEDFARLARAATDELGRR